MLIKKLVKDDKGAVIPLVALLIFVLLGFSVIVVDAGALYLSRREMVTAADAGALAGAQELMKNNGTNTSNAEAVARKIAEQNGADVGTVEALVKNEGGRQVIEVTVKKNTEMIFAKLFEFTAQDIGATSVATWGFIKSISSGDILPLFILEDKFVPGSTVPLHGNKEISDSNYGTLRLDSSGGGANAVRNYLGRDKYFNGTLTLSSKLSGEPGAQPNPVTDGVVSRMDKANAIPGTDELDILARKRIMTGVVPVVNENELLTEVGAETLEDINGFIDQKIPIEYFAVFEIQDTIIDNKGNGTNKQLFKTPHYLTNGSSYHSGTSYDKGTVLGEFTGGTLDVAVNVEPGDQTPPGNPDMAAKYFKLIDADYIGN